MPSMPPSLRAGGDVLSAGRRRRRRIAGRSDRQADGRAGDRSRLDAEKRDFAVQFGADETLDYTKADWRYTIKG